MSRLPSSLSSRRAIFTAAEPSGNPAPFLLADGRIEVTPDNLGERDHVAAINAFKRRLRTCGDPRLASHPEPSG